MQLGRLKVTTGLGQYAAKTWQSRGLPSLGCILLGHKRNDGVTVAASDGKASSATSRPLLVHSFMEGDGETSMAKCNVHIVAALIAQVIP